MVINQYADFRILVGRIEKLVLSQNYL